MALLGTNLTLLIGPTVPVPAPSGLVEHLDEVEVTTSDSERSGFRLGFDAGRSGLADLVDFRLMSQLRPSYRVILVVTFSGMPRVLMDGVITHRELTPGFEPGSGRLTVIGEDISVLMDREERDVTYPAQNELMIATMIIVSHARLGLIPMVVPPPSIDLPIPIERIPSQHQTDLEMLQDTAGRFGYVFYTVPGPAPGMNLAYWGPPIRAGVPQRALSVDLGPETNVLDVTFRQDVLKPTAVAGHVQDRLTNQVLPVRGLGSLRPPLAAMPDWAVNASMGRTVRFRDSGLTALQALARAQGTAEASSTSVTAEGTLEASRYGDLLLPRGLVGLRGAGWSNDGLYYVQRVTHTLRIGEYTQRFTLTREGVGATIPVVRP